MLDFLKHEVTTDVKAISCVETYHNTVPLTVHPPGPGSAEHSPLGEECGENL